MRLFVAAYPPESALDDLARCVAGLAIAGGVDVNTRLTARPRWHVTLAFIGEVDAAAAQAARDALDRAAACAPLSLRLRFAGGGRFGRGRFTIVWAGMSGDISALAKLARDVRAQLRVARVPYDRKPFAPHLTLARPGDRLPADAIAADIAALAGYTGPEWIPASIELVESHLGPHPRHEVLHSASFERPDHPNSTGTT